MISIGVFFGSLFWSRSPLSTVLFLLLSFCFVSVLFVIIKFHFFTIQISNFSPSYFCIHEATDQSKRQRVSERTATKLIRATSLLIYEVHTIQLKHSLENKITSTLYIITSFFLCSFEFVCLSRALCGCVSFKKRSIIVIVIIAAINSWFFLHICDLKAELRVFNESTYTITQTQAQAQTNFQF